MSNTVCYKTKSGKSYLAYYTYNYQKAINDVNTINTTKPLKLFNGDVIDWDDITEFFVQKQEEMD